MADLPLLDARDQRILGALMEKQVTVPSTYPMTLNALRAACNQSNSRDPVSEYDEIFVDDGAKSLKDRGLVRIVWADRGRRTLKYHQLLTEELNVDVREAAALTVLLLRGPQAPGELRIRAERLHSFSDRDEVEQLLAQMAERELVRELPRQPGHKDQRWTHLLGETEAEAQTEVAQPPTDVLSGGASARDDKVRHTYGTIAQHYADQAVDQLAEQPFERWLLDRVAEEASYFPIADAGCGPGHISAYLQDRGALARGFDLSPAMVEVASVRFPEVEFHVGDLRRLIRPVDADGWGAVLGWHSLSHFASSELPGAVAAMARVLRPHGVLVLAFDTGSSERLRTPWSDHDDLDLAMVSHDRSSVLRAAQAAGLTNIEWYQRGPSSERDQTSERLYVLARQR